MLLRDKFSFDFIFRFHPKIDYEHFKRDMFDQKKKMLFYVALKESEINQMVNSYKKSIFVSLGILSVSIVGVVFFKKIPAIGGMKRRIPRVLTKFSMLFFPF